jgi:murein L,D-transpeptidase YcbB/YkuD
LQRPNFGNVREAVKQFYLSTNYALAWISGNKPILQAQTLVNVLQQADLKGLDAQDYDSSRWDSRLNELSATGGSSAAALVRFDLALTVCALRYVSDLHNGRAGPVPFPGLATSKVDLAEFLRNRVLPATNVGAALEEMEPPFSGYRRTLKALEQYLALANDGEGTPIPPPAFPLKVGNMYAGVAPLAERLRRLGDLDKDAALPDQPVIYGGVLATAIQRFQKRHGLHADGTITPETYHELVTPLARRVVQLQLTLERLRWLPANLEPPLIVVNIPEFRMRAYEDHRVALSMRAIVGEAFEHQTPVFADHIDALVFRPYWNVPESIQKKEIVPELRKHPHYLVRYGMQVVDGHGKVVTGDRVSGKVLRQLESGNLRLRQLPGPANALGLVKFVFPNQYDVYMHGTPERGLFARSRRDLSHGCIRIEKPAALAAWVLRDDPEWTPDRINAAMHGENSIEVKILGGAPILILYGTAVVEENGTVNFFRDVYGLDVILQTSLEQKYEKSE